MKHTYHPVNKVRNEVVTIHIRYYSEMDFYIEEFLPLFHFQEKDQLMRQTYSAC